MQLRKVFQGEIPENKIMNSYTESNTDAYSCDYVNEKLNAIELFSTKEQRIGTWIDGKPLYRKTITQVGLSSNTNLSVPHNIENQETIWVDVANSFIHSPQRTVTLPEVGYAGNLTDKTDVYVEGDNVHLYSNGGWGSTWTFVITLKYTKTTD